MGLDMYLMKRTYVRNFDSMPPEERNTVTVTGPESTHIQPDRISAIVERVMYWRKANAIHAWFVRMTQNGRDECQESDVTRDQLVTLTELCETLLAEYAADPVAATVSAKRLLPTQDGFFFGSTDYDEGYWADVCDTATDLRTLLNTTPDVWTVSFTYYASW